VTDGGGESDFWTPIWHSRRNGHRHLKVRPFLAVGIVTLIFPSLVTFALTLPFGSLKALGDMAGTSGVAGALSFSLATVIFLVIFAPVLGVLLVPLAMAVLAIALRFGCAGWGVAMVVVVLLCGTFGLVMLRDPLFTVLILPVALMHAMVLWGGTRLHMPNALLPEVE